MYSFTMVPPKDSPYHVFAICKLSYQRSPTHFPITTYIFAWQLKMVAMTTRFVTITTNMDIHTRGDIPEEWTVRYHVTIKYGCVRSDVCCRPPPPSTCREEVSSRRVLEMWQGVDIILSGVIYINTSLS